VVAALGPKNVAMAAELAEGWEPIFYLPERAADVWGTALAEGTAKRDPSLPALDIIAQAGLAIGTPADTAPWLDLSRPLLALYIGGMGARGRNFYNDLAVRYGYAQEATQIQDAYLDNRKQEAAALIPQSLLEGINLVGPKSWVAERVAALRESGVTTLNVSPLANTHSERVALIELIRDLAS
jgi:alkanesulfonate monooxygenase SsuD/methylene tetrahydromethanopterin reductase-like flavin-dependent oxidoreductase (luciferase family)